MLGNRKWLVCVILMIKCARGKAVSYEACILMHTTGQVEVVNNCTLCSSHIIFELWMQMHVQSAWGISSIVNGELVK